ncbi:hypothetical protein [Nocardia salmonicida]|uniref:hypothetical protein n=1 Tax=Nocardia salmonicida TaxID=53431 RepID=UPI00340D0D96
MAISDNYKGTLPYASEQFGIYQPLLGWVSNRTKNRYSAQRSMIYDTVAVKTANRPREPVELHAERDAITTHGRLVIPRFRVENLQPMSFDQSTPPRLDPSIDCAVSRLFINRLDHSGPPERMWADTMTPDQMSNLLHEIQDMLNDSQRLEANPSILAYLQRFHAQLGPDVDSEAMLRDFFDKETRIAGYLIFLSQHNPEKLTELLFDTSAIRATLVATAADPLLSFGDKNWTAILSPIGLVHLYRQYFFEFDSFLGPPVGHVWLSPGGTTELIEVNTRRTVTERSFESLAENIKRSETDRTNQDELSTAVKNDNSTNLTLGVTNVANFRTPIFQDTLTASLSHSNASKDSRETTHKQMRSQSEKLSSEIKENFKTTFRTLTEVTDTTSKRYVIANTTPRLVNYELRRKMRKVGVQVQDIGVQLCWHTFVDDPGSSIGVGQLVHVGAPPEQADLKYPDQPPAMDPIIVNVNVPLAFSPKGDAPGDIAYVDGGQETIEKIAGIPEVNDHIEVDYPVSVSTDKPGYNLVNVVLNPQGADVIPVVKNIQYEPGSSAGTFDVHLSRVNFHGQQQIMISAELHWQIDESIREKARAAFEEQVGKYTEENHQRYKDAYLAASRERIDMASRIVARNPDDLREEERTVIYRKLIGELIGVGVDNAATMHVTSELVRSIFDVDKMLYFVAAEWWIPRQHRSTQVLGRPVLPQTVAKAQKSVTSKPGAAAGESSISKFAGPGSITSIINKVGVLDPDVNAPSRPPIPATNVVGWGGETDRGRDSYYITETSAPARMGSSLGWLLQLDGDDLRNAMLNSPWVKAVIPIRVGKEKAAINWLRQAHVEGAEGLGAKYTAVPNDPVEIQSTPDHTVTVEEALDHMINRIDLFQQHSRTPVVANPAEPDDASNHFVGSLPTEAVFEHGFYPLQDGVRFDGEATEQAVFSQWTEILPTDQIAAVEVEYDPETLAVKVVDQPPRVTTAPSPVQPADPPHH